MSSGIFDWLQLKRRPTEALPTALDVHRGQVRVVSGNGTSTDDELWFGRNDAGTNEWVRLGHSDDLATIQADIITISNDLATKQDADLDLSVIAGLTPTTNNFIQSAASNWASRTPSQAKTSLALVKGDVGLGNVDNTSDATKDAAVATLTNKTLTTPTIADLTNAQHDHLSAGDGGVLTGYSRGLQTGFFTPPGFMAAGLAGVTVATSNQTIAVYLGQAPFALTSVVLRCEVTTAYIAAGTTWAEIGIATSPLTTMNGAATLTRVGFTDVASTFASTGEKSTTVAVTIPAGSHVWALWGSQATTTIYNLMAGIGDGVTSGRIQFRAATRISTFSPTAFAATGNPQADAWFSCQWS